MSNINLTIHDSRVSVSAGDPCVAGEANASLLVMTFDPAWDGLAKTAVFRDARGESPVGRMLTADLLDSADPDGRTYRLPIPGEPLAYPGEFTLVVDGIGEGRRLRTRPVCLPVDGAPDTDGAAAPADPTPDRAQQLQGEIDAILADIHAVARAADYAIHPPTVGEDGNWQLWDGEQYADTGLPSRGAQGEKGERGEPGPQGETGPAYELTQADKDTLVQAVLDALPAAEGVSF